MSDQKLVDADELARRNKFRVTGESPEYRTARAKLLAEEIELRRHIERVARLRRALPPGAPVTREFKFVGENGPTTLNEMFGDKQTLIIYSYMFGPKREAPCPMCTSFMGTFENKIADIQQRVSLAFTARSPIERLQKAKAERGWKYLPVFSDSDGDYTKTFINADDADVPGYTVFTKRDGQIYHFYSAEMGSETADPGQDPRGAPDMDPLWLLLDTTPEGRGSDFYPKLNY